MYTVFAIVLRDMFSMNTFIPRKIPIKIKRNNSCATARIVLITIPQRYIAIVYDA